MKKHIATWTVKESTLFNNGRYCLLKLSAGAAFPEIRAGQFVQALIENSASVFLRRPVSVHFADREKREIQLLVQVVGDGTRKLSELKKGDHLNLIYPLGNGFTLPEKSTKNSKLALLIGGGIGAAPLLFLSAELRKRGCTPNFLLGARTKEDFLQIREFEKSGKVYLATEDGSAGETGYVTAHSILQSSRFDLIYTCGPRPMMVAVARYAREKEIPCEVSLENTMACGFGVCLCCTEKTVNGNLRVCTEGPVMNINQLAWQI
jgi:dihydroorotate dehydrogenase electron transfer subunit